MIESSEMKSLLHCQRLNEGACIARNVFLPLPRTYTLMEHQDHLVTPKCDPVTQNMPFQYETCGSKHAVHSQTLEIFWA